MRQFLLFIVMTIGCSAAVGIALAYLIGFIIERSNPANESKGLRDKARFSDAA